MKLETTGFKDGRKNDRFKCGMYRKPYAQENQCNNLAVRIVTDESYLAYRRYWPVWNKFHVGHELPLMHLRIICKDHLDQIKALPDEPKPKRRK